VRAASSDRGVSVLTRPDRSAQGDDVVANRHPDPVGANDRVDPIASLTRSATSSGETAIHTFSRLRTSDTPQTACDPLGSLALRSDIDDSTQRHPADVDVDAEGRQSVEEEEGIEPLPPSRRQPGVRRLPLRREAAVRREASGRRAGPISARVDRC
jgi:hypothetical protein